MTTKKAITLLSQLSAGIKGVLDMHYAEAIDMAIEALKAQERKYTFGTDEFSLEDAYHDCKIVFDGITDDESYQEADTGLILHYANEIIYALRKALEVEQSEQRCVNCGRTANNGGWYRDGRTRCPIEEHYALPKDGYCHLWEKRKDWEDAYVKRAKEGEK